MSERSDSDSSSSVSSSATSTSSFDSIPVGITWRDVGYDVDLPPTRAGFPLCCKVVEPGKEKSILTGNSGAVRSGEFLAIMGPSGAGKSTLLNVLASRYTEGVNGSITVNGQPATRGMMRQVSAVVFQDDLLLPSLTPYEILTFSAALRLPQSMTSEEKQQRVEDLIDELGLQKARDTRVGKVGGTGGISGGERKRVSIAVELLTDPALLIVDEPTSGLDSATAENVISTLRDLAASGRTVICTIHQPSSEIYALFDKLLLLARGHTVYFGKATDAVDYFASQGYPCPQFSNPSDYFLRLLAEPHVDRDEDSYSNEESAGKTNGDHLDKLITAWAAGAEATEVNHAIEETNEDFRAHAVAESSSTYKSSYFVQFYMLLWRAFVTQIRTPILFQARLGQTIFLGLVVGLLYYNLDDDQKSIQDRQGALFFVIINQCMSTLFGNLQTIPLELPLFAREHFNGMYSVSAYYFTKIIADVPFQIVFPTMFGTIIYFMLGLTATFDQYLVFIGVIILVANAGVSLSYCISAVSVNADMALALGPLVMIPLLLFGGLFVNVDSIPGVLVWGEAISPIRWGYEAVAINEFTDLTLECTKKQEIPQPPVCLSGVPVTSCNATDLYQPDPSCPITSGNTVLETAGFESELWEPVLNLAIIMVGFRILGLIFLRIRIWYTGRNK